MDLLMGVFIFIVIVIIISILLRVYHLHQLLETKKKYNLKKDGVCLLKHVFSNSEIENMKRNVEDGKTLMVKEYIINSKKLQDKIKKLLGADYTFHDYIFSIKRSQIHTCHRDYNGDFFNKAQKYPSYTIILYLENMEKCLEVIPKSHESLYYNAINLTDPTEPILCNAGDIVLFNANLIHSGAINIKEDNIRIQMKISHKTDHKTLHCYQKYNKELDKKNITSKWSKYITKHVSCQFPGLGIFTQQYDFDVTKKANDKSSLFSYLLYGDSQFYNLKQL